MKKAIIFIILVSIGVVVLLTAVAGGKQMWKVFISASANEIFFAACLMILVVFLDSLRTKLLSAVTGKKISLKKCLENTLLGMYVSALTPFSAGGQPFQVYHLSQQGIAAESSSMIVGVKFITSFSVMLSAGFLFLAVLNKKILQLSGARWLMIAGLVLTCIMYVFFLLLIFSKRIAVKIILSKPLMKIISIALRKNTQKILEQATTKVDNYFRLVRNLWKESRLLVIANILITVIIQICFMSIPYLCLRSVTSTINSTYWQFLGMMFITTTSVYFIPTPGSVGGVEGAFYLIFRGICSSTYIASTVILWRSITYYSLIIVGTLLISKNLFASFREEKL